MQPPPPPGFPPGTPHPGFPGGAAPRRPGVSTASRTITILLICLSPMVCLGATFWGAFSVMATASCGAGECRAAGVAIQLMIFSPWVLWLIAGIWATVLLIRKKPALWVMVTGLAVEVVIYLGANIALFMLMG